LEWLRIVLTSVLSYLVLFGLAKLMGRRQISQLDMFDYITGITIGSIAAELATELEKPLQPLTAMIVIGLLTVLLNILTDKSRRAAKFINGSPLVLFDAGQFQKKNMKRVKLELGEFLNLCRNQGYFDLSAVHTAVFEPNGKLTIWPVTARRPVTPQDMGLQPAQEPVLTEFVMDGKVMTQNLQNAGFDEKWLTDRLKAQGFSSPAEVFLAQWDQQGNLSVYRLKD